MKPANQAERQKAFLNFLLFFVLTIIVIVTTIAFSFKVPLEDNNKLRAERNELIRQKSYLSTQGTIIQETIALLDSVNMDKSRVFYFDSQIKKNLSKLSDENNKDTSSVKNFIDKVIYNLQQLQEVKRQIREQNDESAKQGDKDKQIYDLKEELFRCQQMVKMK